MRPHENRNFDRFFNRASWAASQVVGVAPQLISNLDRMALQASGMAVLDDKAEAAKKALGGRGEIGFDIGWGLMHLPVTSQQIAEVRSGLSVDDQHGFDVALALQIGNLSAPNGARIAVTPSVGAGYAITHGAFHAPKKRQAAIVSTAMASPGGAVGAQRAAGEIRKAKHGRFGGLSIWDGVLIAAGTLVGGFVGGSLVWAAVGGAAGGVADVVRRKVST
jgi:hypothetical protein